jgi:hypothetical protein
MTPPIATAPDVAIEMLQARAGVYRSVDKYVIPLVERHGKLHISGLPMPLRPLGPDMFAFEGDPYGVTIDFEGLDGDFVLSRAGGPTRRYTRCDPPTGVNENEFTGDFQSPEVGAPCTVNRTDAGLSVSFAGQRPAALRALAPDCLWAADLGSTLTFERGDDGVVRGFRADNDRVRGIAFSRIT